MEQMLFVYAAHERHNHQNRSIFYQTAHPTMPVYTGPFDIENMPPHWQRPLQLLRQATIATQDVPRIIPKFDSREAAILFWFVATKNYEMTCSACHCSKTNVSRVITHWRQFREIPSTPKRGRPVTITLEMRRAVEAELLRNPRASLNAVRQLLIEKFNQKVSIAPCSSP